MGVFSVGWPKNVNTKEKQQFLKDFYDREGVYLNPDNMAPSPGMRLLDKFCLNIKVQPPRRRFRFP